jgi:hypothetical protein
MLEAEIDEPAEVDGRHSQRKTELIAADASVANPAMVVGHQPGDRSLDHGAPTAVAGDTDARVAIARVVALDDRAGSAPIRRRRAIRAARTPSGHSVLWNGPGPPARIRFVRGPGSHLGTGCPLPSARSKDPHRRWSPFDRSTHTGLNHGKPDGRMTASLDPISNRAVPGILTNNRPRVTAPENDASGSQDSGPSSTLSHAESRRAAANASITAPTTNPAMIIGTTAQACPLRTRTALWRVNEHAGS